MPSSPIPDQPSCTDQNEFGSLKFDDALAQIMGTVEPITGYQCVTLASALDRVLHEPIKAPKNVPAHTNSAVDGYAVRSEDLPKPGDTAKFAIIGTALAGKPANMPVESNAAIRIMTGAVIPERADTVLMQEHVSVENSSICVSDRHRAGDNIRKAGEDLRQGDVVLSSGRRCTPADLGLIASLGLGETKVKRRVRVAIFSTGTEIHPIGKKLQEGELYDSNRVTLRAALTRIGTEIIDFGIIPDDRPGLIDCFNQAAASADLIITTGGVSVGQADYTREALSKLGKILFSKVAIKPGRPLAFGTIENIPFFGLPGNPVAVMVTFYQFVLPALQKLMGITEPLLSPKLAAVSAEPIRKRPGRTEFQRAILSPSQNGWQVRSTGRQGSGILKSMNLANSFIVLPHECGAVNPGETVIVQPFSGLI